MDLKLSPSGQKQMNELWDVLRKIQKHLEALEKAHVNCDAQEVKRILDEMFC